jgi:hypothetical protein
LVLLKGEINELAIEMGSCTSIHKPSFIKTGSAIQKLIGGYTFRQTDIHTDSKVIS